MSFHRQDPALERFLENCQMRKFRKNAEIIQAGSPSDSIYYIVKGSVSVIIEGPEEKQQFVVRYLTAGAFFGELGLFQEEPVRTAIIRTKSECEVAEITYDRFRQVVKSDIDILFRVCRQMAERLGVTTQKIGDLAFMDTKGRIARSLLELCKQADAVTHPDGMMVKISRQELAKNVGCSREMVGRVVKELELEGILEAQGMNIVVFGTR